MKKEEKGKVEKFIKRQRKDGNVAAAEVTSKKNKKKKENEVNNDNNNVTTKEKVLHAKKPPNKNYTADDAATDDETSNDENNLEETRSRLYQRESLKNKRPLKSWSIQFSFEYAKKDNYPITRAHLISALVSS